MHLENTVSVDNNATLTILPGTTVLLGDNKSLNIRPGSKIIAEGTEEEPIRFIRADPSKEWNKIDLRSSAGNSFKWVLFDGGNKNVDIASKNNTFAHCTFRNGWRGISGWHNQDGSGNSSATISYSLVENNSSVGVVAHYIDLDMSYTTIKNNAQAGLYILAGTTHPFHHNLVTNNGLVQTSRDGIEVKSSGSLWMQPDIVSYGFNVISNNADDQISNSGDLTVGHWFHGIGGRNSIYGDYTGSHYLIDNNSGYSVPIYENYWGLSYLDVNMVDGPFTGTLNYLSTDPTTSENPGADGQVPTKAISPTFTNEAIAEAYEEIENELAQAKNKAEVRNRLYRLYQLAGLSDDAEVKEAFKTKAQAAATGSLRLFDAGEQSIFFRDIAKMLYTKSLVRDEQYGQTRDFLQETDFSGLRHADRHDYLHYKMITQTYHGKYQQALATLQTLYDFEEQEGANMEEVKAGYSTFEEDIIARIEAGEGGNNIREKSVSQDLGTKQLSLSNYPNPFNPTTNITFMLPQKSAVSLVVFDMLGREVATLVNEVLAAGEQTVRFDASSLANGMYLYKLRAGNQQITKKMMLIK